MKFFVAALVALAFLVGCISNPDTGETEVDWKTVSKGLELGASRLRDPALHQMLEQDPAAVAALNEVAGAAELAAETVKAFEAGDTDLDTLLGKLRAVTLVAQTVTPLIHDEELSRRVSAGVFILNGAIDIAILLMPEDSAAELAAPT